MTAVVLHPRDLSGCEHRLALDTSHADLAAQMSHAPDTTRRIQAATDHRMRIRDLLRALHSDQNGLTFRAIDVDASRSARIEETRTAVADGVAWIWCATLPVDRGVGRRGDSELLARVGDGYVPVIVVNHRVSYPASPQRPLDAAQALSSPLFTWSPQLDPSRNARNQRRDQLRLAQITAMLIDLGIAPTTDGVIDRNTLRAGVIGLDADCIVVHEMGPLLAEYDEVFDRRQAIAGQRVHTEARRVGECRGCPWWGRCEPELIERRDVSLVVRGNEWKALDAVGITTIDQLAHHRGDAPPDWPGKSRFTDAIVSAIAWLTDTVLIRRVDNPTVRRADVEIDVDMESYGESGAYLWGTLLTDTTDPTREVRYRPFVTWTPLPTTDEGRSFAEFWEWLMAERAAAHESGKTFAAYCYSQQAENRWLRGSADRFAGMPGIPERGVVDDFIASDEWVDVFEAVGRNFICPQGKGLKRVAPVAGHHWRDPDASGEASMDWYRIAVALDGGVPDEGQRHRLLEYNEDDVVATKVLREWMTDRARLETPHEDDLLSYRGGRDPGSGPRGA